MKRTHAPHHVMTAALLGAAVLAAPAAAGAATAKSGGHAKTHAARSAKAHAADRAPRPATRTLALSVRKGDSLLGVMRRAGLARPQNMAAILAAGHSQQARRMQIGDTVRVVLARKSGAEVVQSIRLSTDDAAVAARDDAPAPAQRSVERAPRPPLHDQTRAPVRDVALAVRKGDSLLGVMRRAGLAKRQNMAAILAADHSQQVRRMRAGDTIHVELEQRAGGETIRAIRLGTDDVALAAPDAAPPVRHVAASGPAAVAKPAALSGPSLRQTTGTVGTSLASALHHADVPRPVIAQALVALRRDPRAPKRIGRTARYSISYVPGKRPALRTLALSTGRKGLWTYSPETAPARLAVRGTRNGHLPANAVVVPVALAEPVARPQISSPYGWRVHPVLGSWRFHKGVDFRAPRGTPVYAAADGVVAEIGRRGNYGDYIRIRHDGAVQTAYAHLDGFVSGLHAGSTVERGQPIGYVGRTGLATGCHLYYEVIVNGQRVDPMKVVSRPEPLIHVGQAETALRQIAQNE